MEKTKYWTLRQLQCSVSVVQLLTETAIEIAKIS